MAEPHAGPGQVRVRVRAAGVNPIDFKVRRGWTQGFIDVTFPATPGLEVAGVVDEAGEGAEFAVGDEVVGWSATGSYAEHAIVANVARKPEGLSWEQAVGLPVAGETAQRVLDDLQLKEGETLLLHGAAGAVGSIAAQLAKAAGVNVVGTASPANHDFLRSIGVIPVAYGEGLLDRVREAAPRRESTRSSTPPARADSTESIELRGGTDRIVTIADMQAAARGIAVSSGSSAHPGPDPRRPEQPSCSQPRPALSRSASPTPSPWPTPPRLRNSASPATPPARSSYCSRRRRTATAVWVRRPLVGPSGRRSSPRAGSRRSPSRSSRG